MVGVGRPLVSTEQPPLDERGDPVHRGQQLTGILTPSAGGALAAPIVDVAEPVQAEVPRPPVGDHRGARLHVIGDERVQRGRGGVLDRRHPASTEPLGTVDLHGNTGEDLLASLPPASQSRLLPADEGLVHLHRPVQPLPARSHQHRPQAVQHRPRGLVGADFERPLQAQRRDAVLAAGEQPAGGEPHRQRRPGPVEDRARGHRSANPATSALEPSVVHPPATAVTAARTDEPVWPAQPLQVVQAVVVGAEPGLKLPDGSRIVHAGTRLIHCLRLGRLDGYPQPALIHPTS